MTPPRFVVQERHEKGIRYYFRLEMDGFLKGWNIPKNLPIDAGVKRLAIQISDRNISSYAFENSPEEEIKSGEYIKIYDKGYYALQSKDDNNIVVLLDGKIFHGRYQLQKMEKNWLIFRRK